MPTLLLTSGVAFVLALLFTPALRFGLAHAGWAAHSRRRRLALPGESLVPRLGGVAVLAAAVLALLLRAWLRWPVAGRGDHAIFGELAGPVLLVLLVGALDDWWNLPPVAKFAGQILAALWIVHNGLRIGFILYHPLPVWLGAALTVLWLVGCSNAFNLIDGLDGLATGLAVFATATVLAHAVLIGEPGLALLMGALFGALAAFLGFNFPPASIYLGDAGSLSIGFLLGGAALAWANKATTAVGLLAPLFALLVPMFDTGTALLRRGLTGQPLFGGDHRHIHHRLLQRGLTSRNAVLVLYGIAGLGAVAALLLADIHQRHSFELVILLFVGLFAAGLYLLGYDEFSQAGRVVRRGLLDPRRRVRSLVTLREGGREIAGAGSYERVWECLCESGRRLDFHGLELRVGSAAHPRWARSVCWKPDAPSRPGAGAFAGWVCHIPLGEDGEAGMLTYWRDLSAPHSGFVKEIAQLLGEPLTERLPELGRAGARAAAAGAPS